MQTSHAATHLRVVEDDPYELIGASPAIRGMLGVLDRLAASAAPVLVTGETGTGKELVVRALHARSPRRAGPLVALNCAAMPAALLESELFGHVRGAFTDARADRRGLLVAANGGTLFLDEVGELPLELQPKLLRALQERRVRPLGATEEVAFDARIVAATHRDLGALCDAGQFRRDLLFRLDVLPLSVPPLRTRAGDVALLAEHFAARAPKSLAPDALARLVAYPWPGNVRELASCIEYAVALATGPRITAADLPPKLAGAAPAGTAPAPTSFVTLAELERDHIRRVLAAHAGNKAAAARTLGIERRTLYRMLQRA